MRWAKLRRAFVGSDTTRGSYSRPATSPRWSTGAGRSLSICGRVPRSGGRPCRDREPTAPFRMRRGSSRG
eukprot:13027634-Alexandrium_andersonii.AAC.1